MGTSHPFLSLTGGTTCSASQPLGRDDGVVKDSPTVSLPLSHSSQEVGQCMCDLIASTEGSRDFKGKSSTQSSLSKAGDFIGSRNEEVQV